MTDGNTYRVEVLQHVPGSNSSWIRRIDRTEQAITPMHALRLAADNDDTPPDVRQPPTIRRYQRVNSEVLSDEDLLAVPLPVAFWQSLLEGLNNGEFVDPDGAIAERIGGALGRSGWLS